MPAPGLIRRISEFDRRRGRRVSPAQVRRDALLDIEVNNINNRQAARERAEREAQKRATRARNRANRTRGGQFAPSRPAPR